MLERLLDDPDIAIDRFARKPLVNPFFLQENKGKRGKIIDRFVSIVLRQQGNGIAAMDERRSRLSIFYVISFGPFEEADGQFLAKLKRKVERIADENGTSVNFLLVNMIRKADPNMQVIENEEDAKYVRDEIGEMKREIAEMRAAMTTDSPIGKIRKTAR